MADSLQLPCLFWRGLLAGHAPAPRDESVRPNANPPFVTAAPFSKTAKPLQPLAIGEPQLPDALPTRYNRTCPA